ncbi:MAG: hypothetical protein ACK5NN_09635 [Sphingomonadaceae bacterium]
MSVASCAMPKSNDDPSATPLSGADQPVTSLQDIKGFWLVERFGDFEPSWRNFTPWRSSYVQIGDGHLTYAIGCNQSGNPAALGPSGILQDTGDGGRMQTLQGCGDVREARDGRFFAFFGSNPEVRKLDADRIVLKSSKRELVLIRPDRWRQTNKPAFKEIEGRWVPQMSTTYDGWELSGFGLGDDPGVVTIDRGRVMWSQCPELPISIRWTNDARLASTDTIDVRDCRAVAHATSNGPGTMMTMLAASPSVIRIGADWISLVVGSGEKGRRIDLQAEQSVLNPPSPPPMPEGLKTPPIAPPPPTNR